MAVADPTKAQTAKTITPPPFQITPLHQRHRWLNLAIYGKFGTGKTTLAGSSVDVLEMRDVIMVNAESGTLSIEDSEEIKHPELIDQVRVEDFKTVAYVHDFLKKHCTYRDANQIEHLKALQARLFGYDKNVIDEKYEGEDIREVNEDPTTTTKARLRKYRTVIVDSLSEIDTFSMYELLKIDVNTSLDDEVDVAEWPEFRKNNQRMQMLVRAYRDLPMHTILVCNSKYAQDERKVFHYSPGLTGQLKDQVQGFVDIVGYMQSGNSEPKPGQQADNKIIRRLAIQPTRGFDAKNRIASFKQPYFTDPMMQDIMDAFNRKRA